MVDGNLSDWVLADRAAVNLDTVEFIHPRSVPGATDSSALIWSSWTDDTLFLAARVWDDVVMADSGEIWRDDSLEFAFDGARDFNAGGTDDHVITIAVDGRVVDFGSEPLPEVQRAVRLLADGYALEMAIPASTIQWPAWGLDHMAGFTIGLHDDDDGGDWDSYLIWKGTSVNSEPQNYGIMLFSDGSGCHFADVQPNSAHANPDTCDGDIDIADIQRVASCWMRPTSPACPASLNLNGWGDVDVFDIITATEMWSWHRLAGVQP